MSGQHRPWSLSRYATTLALALLALFGALVWLFMARLGPIQEGAALRESELARTELEAAFNAAAKTARYKASALAEWEEAVQQIGDARFYEYWRNYRVPDAGLLTDHIVAIDLYDRDGRNLNPAATAAGMPARLAAGQVGMHLEREANRVHLYFVQALKFKTEGNHASGYAAVKLDLLGFLRETNALTRIEHGSIAFAPDLPARPAPEQFQQALRYQVMRDESSTHIQALVTDFLIQGALLLLASVLLIYLFLRHGLGRPLRQITDHIDQLSLTGRNPEVPPFKRVLPVAELEKVRTSLNGYQEQLDAMQSSLEHSNAQLWSLAHHDPLTGTYNRRAYEEDWERLLAMINRHHFDVSFILFDCDHFKTINDSYGHHVGDAVIQAIAEALDGTLREGEKLYRLGGDEFACLLAHATAEDAEKLAMRAEQAVAALDFCGLGVREPVRISVGIAHADGQGKPDFEDLAKRADLAMYYAKRPGNHKIVLHTEAMEHEAKPVLSSSETSAVYEAMREPERLVMAYQPIARLPGQAVEYYEALARIKDGDRLIMPGGIFPVVEAHRLEAEFDLAILGRIEQDLINGIVPRGTGVSLNVSGPGILNPRIKEKLLSMARLIDRYKLVLEVTETALITQIGHASATLNVLREAGFLVALDDFGSGYSSLRYLSNMPVDLVKFDISMIRGLEGDPRQSSIVENMARLIRGAGYGMVAEGIETEATLAKVASLGFTHAQGYWLGKPSFLY